MQLRLHATLAAAGRLPEELARGLGRSSAGPVGPSELCWALGAFAFAELFFSFHTAQEAIDEACQSFGAQLSSGAEPEDLLCAAEQLVKQKAGPQGLSSLYVFSAPFIYIMSSEYIIITISIDYIKTCLLLHDGTPSRMSSKCHLPFWRRDLRAAA